jgi:protein-tyrosine-phosphatase
MAKPRILFVCPGDASRSLMARGFVRYYAGPMVEVESAAIDPKPPSAYIAWGMNETSIPISEDQARPLKSVKLEDFDHIVSFVDGTRVSLPPLSSHTRVEEWLIADPSRVRGQTSDVIRAIRLIRYQIEARVQALLQRVLAGADSSR